MLKIACKYKLNQTIKAQCERHRKYDPSLTGRGGIEDNCAMCKELLTLYKAKVDLDDALRAFQRKAMSWEFQQAGRKKRPELPTDPSIK